MKKMKRLCAVLLMLCTVFTMGFSITASSSACGFINRSIRVGGKGLVSYGSRYTSMKKIQCKRYCKKQTRPAYHTIKTRYGQHGNSILDDWQGIHSVVIIDKPFSDVVVENLPKPIEH